MSDFLVIGSGIAGLSFAIKAAEHGSVTIITKGKLLESNTAWAQGGISAVLPPGLRDPEDNCEKHIADTLDAGGGLCHDDAVEVIIAEAAETIEELVAWGSDFDRDHDDPERYSLCKEGGHSERRILHSKDTTGREIATSLVETMRKTKNITILEDHYAIDLITTGKLGAVTDDRILGAYVLDIKEGRVSPIESPRVILATGGCGKTYLYTTNPDSSTGDGLAMCWRAGAEIANMEFIQFHPTCFYNPAATGPEARSFLVSEAVRGEGAVLVNGEGHQFVNDHDPRGSLAPRDIVARAIDTEIKRTGAPCVYLDVSP
ncbi:FAD-dependent oxidoreductase, partial [Akkermansiaceae bacterium]|nr:FAD-dependent oxidoreductase [Akkermansiaceae bacterium]